MQATNTFQHMRGATRSNNKQRQQMKMENKQEKNKKKATNIYE
jgi:hypothetical protein